MILNEKKVEKRLPRIISSLWIASYIGSGVNHILFFKNILSDACNLDNKVIVENDDYIWGYDIDRIFEDLVKINLILSTPRGIVSHSGKYSVNPVCENGVEYDALVYAYLNKMDISIALRKMKIERIIAKNKEKVKPKRRFFSWM